MRIPSHILQSRQKNAKNGSRRRSEEAAARQLHPKNLISFLSPPGGTLKDATVDEDLIPFEEPITNRHSTFRKQLSVIKIKFLAWDFLSQQTNLFILLFNCRRNGLHMDFLLRLGEFEVCVWGNQFACLNTTKEGRAIDEMYGKFRCIPLYYIWTQIPWYVSMK